MLALTRKGAWALLSLALATLLGIHSVRGQEPTHGWYDWVLYGATAVSVLFLIVTSDRTRRALGRRPKLVSGEVRAFHRRASGSRGLGNDLEVVYARVKNARNGGGDKATLFDAQTWMEARDERDNVVARCQGNWLSLRTGSPDPNPLKSATIRPTGEEIGLEIGGKFIWGDKAWLAGETHPSLGPGRYRIKARVSDGVHRSQDFEWELVNQGQDKPLLINGATPLTPAMEILANLPGTAAAMASASQAPAHMVASDLGRTGETGRGADTSAKSEDKVIASSDPAGDLFLEILDDEHWSTWKTDTYILEVPIRITNTTGKQKETNGLGFAWRGSGQPFTRMLEADLRQELNRRERQHNPLPRFIHPDQSLTAWVVKAVPRPPEGGHGGYEIGTQDELGVTYAAVRPAQRVKPHVWGEALADETKGQK